MNGDSYALKHFLVFLNKQKVREKKFGENINYEAKTNNAYP